MEQLCRDIGMPEEVSRILQEIDKTLTLPDCSRLLREESWNEGLDALREELGEDPDGFRHLWAMLRCAMTTREMYRKFGLSDRIYSDTMSCFSRFVREHRGSYGSYGFDREWWTVRQISCLLFRIGQLEYELTALDGKPVLSLHIPTDVDFSKELLKGSLAEARDLLGRVFPQYRNAPVFCRSWLLSPVLKDLLPETSRILAFQEFFDIAPVEVECRGILVWVFRNPRLPYDQLPEETSLQRKLKAFLLSGGCFVDGKGYLKD